VFGHLAIGWIQIRLLAAGMLHPGLDVVRDDGFGYATQELQGAQVGANPAGQFLALSGFGTLLTPAPATVETSSFSQY